MSEQTLLLPTKLRPPVRPAGNLPRARLVDALLEQSNRKLQLVIAPAGYGKTTLLTDFVADAPFPVAWLTLDPADRDPHSFVEYLVAALRQPFPACGEATLRMLGSTQDIGARSAALARTLAADVYANIPALCLVVLDDFQEVNDSAAVTGFLDELLRLLPENLRLVLASRTRPNLACLPRLAIQSEVAEFDVSDLRFTGEEVRALLQVRGAELSAEQAQSLAERSEGWIAGLLLSAHVVRDGAIERMARALGQDGPVFDYLADAAYASQSHDLRNFLLASSVPRTVDASVCEALLGPGPWLEKLEEAMHASLFLSRLLGNPPSFRYHQLFREFLQNRLRREQPEQYRRLHLAGAELMAARADWSSALGHYQEADAHVEAASLIRRIAPQLEREGRWYLLSRSIDGLPDQVRSRWPELLVCRARAASLTGSAALSITSVESAVEQLAAAGHPELEAQAHQILGRLLRLVGRTDQAIGALETALRLDPMSPELRAETRRDLGLCLGVRGDFAAATEHLRAALSWFEQEGTIHQVARTEAGLGMVCSRAGRVQEAAAFYERALARWRRVGEEPGQVGLVLNNLGFLRYLQGQSTVAQDLLKEGLEDAHATGNARVIAASQGSMGEMLLARGDHEGAEAWLERALALAEELGDSWGVWTTSASLGLCSLLADALQQSALWLDRADAVAEQQNSPYERALIQIDRALLHLRWQQPETSLALLEQATETLEQEHAERDLVRVKLVRAFALDQAGQVALARSQFQSALAAATSIELPGLLDLPAVMEPERFAALDPGPYRAVRDAVLDRIRPAHQPLNDAGPGQRAAERLAASVWSFGRGRLALTSGQVAEWGRDKARELFFYLLFDGPARAEQIVGDLWPTVNEARARAQLYAATYALRRAVHADALRIVNREYQLAPDLLASHDLEQFDQLVADAGRTLDDTERIRLLTAATALTDGRFLDGIDGAWAAGHRRRHEVQLVSVLTELAAAHARREEWRASLNAALRALELDQRPDLCAHAVRAYVHLDDPTGARRLLREYRSVIAEAEDADRRHLERLARELARTRS